MNVVYATYIDNQEEIKYPIEFIKSKIPELVVFCSDEKNKNYLLSQGIDAKIIGIKINDPIDISIAQNKCIEEIFSTTEASFVVWVQADIHITEKGFKVINDFCKLENITQTCALGLVHLKLFHLCGHSYYGVNVIGIEAWKRVKFTGDGAYLGLGGADYFENDYNDDTIDIGYLTIEQCRNHFRQHKKTWKSTSEEIVNEMEFVIDIVVRNNYKGLIKEDSKYFELIKEMGLVEEYNKVKAIVCGML